MAETTVQQKVCKTCGAEIRPRSMFCYNCGSSVSVEKNGKTEVSGIWLRENIAEEEKPEPIVKEEKAEKTGKVEKVETVEKNEKNEKVSDPVHLNPSKDEKEETELKSAAELRRKAKSYQQKRVEIVWEEPESNSNIKLVLATLLLLGFAVAVIVLAFYLK